MTSYSHLYNELLVVADDPIYILPLLEVLPNANGKLLRKGNHETRYLGTDLVRYRWQNIYYPISRALGLSLHEM